MHAIRTTLLALTAFAALATLPAAATAAPYNVVSCDLAGGAQNAWAPASNHSQMTAYSVCPSNGDWGRGIIVRNGIASSSLIIGQNSGANQSFTAPAGTGITNVRFTGQLYRAAGQRWNVGLTNGYQVLFGIDGSTTWAFGVNLTDYNIGVPYNRSVYWEVNCVATSGCDTKSTGDTANHYVRAGAWIRSTVVTIDDPTLPNVAWRGSLLTGSWVRGDKVFDWDANDNSGISSTSATIGGRTIVNQNEGCDYTRPQPCPTGAAGNTTVSTAGWPDGGHSARIEVRDAAGNLNDINGAVYLDNTAPTRATNLTVQGGENWRPTNSFKLTWTNPTGQAAPITTRWYKLCPTDGGACTTQSAAGAGEDLTVQVPRQGSWRAQIWLEDQAGNVSASNASDSVLLRFDDSTPAATKLSGPGEWASGDQTEGLRVILTLTDGAGAPISGIAGYSTTTNGQDPDATIDTDSTWTTPELAEGTQTLKARAISGSGKAGPIVTRTIKVDRTAPAADATGLPDPGIWQDQPVTLKLTATDALSGAASIHWQLDNEPAHDDTGDKTQITISDDGRHTLTWEAIDKAGNHSRARQAVIRIDRSGPDNVTMLPADPQNPRRITAAASDQGSGINTGVLQIRPVGGGWRDLDTTFDPDTGRLAAQLDDIHLADGNYQLRATATDTVGNSRTSTPATIDLPLRSKGRVTLASSTSGSRFVTGTVRGADGKPLAGATLTVSAKPRTTNGWKTEHTIRCGKTGRFRYRVPVGPTRTLRFTFQGTNTIRPASADRTQLVKASTTIRVNRRQAQLGQTIRFSGRLKGRPIPADGKVLELQAYDGGRWRSFPQVVTTNKTGRWSSTLRFERTQGTYTYRIRARVFRDGSYPYETGVSRTIRLTIHGS